MDVTRKQWLGRFYHDWGLSWWEVKFEGEVRGNSTYLHRYISTLVLTKFGGNPVQWQMVSSRGSIGTQCGSTSPRIVTENVMKVLWDSFSWSVFLHYFREINQRVCSNPVDRVNGLNFLLYQPRIPVYRENKTVDQAWSRCWLSLRDHIKSSIREELGLNADQQPTWQQLLNHTEITTRR